MFMPVLTGLVMSALPRMRNVAATNATGTTG